MKYGSVKLSAAQSTENELISQPPYSCCQGNYDITHRAAVVKGVCRGDLDSKPTLCCPLTVTSPH